MFERTLCGFLNPIIPYLILLPFAIVRVTIKTEFGWHHTAVEFRYSRSDTLANKAAATCVYTGNFVEILTWINHESQETS